MSITRWFARVPALALALTLSHTSGQEASLKTGPAVGARIPVFEAVDHTGQPRTFESLRGPNGLVLVFVRSADW
ncbi:MAG: hypothetical protein ACK5AZ_08210 [Bryobacteraceae bacterium]